MAKKQLNLEPGFTEDDKYIVGLIEMAEQAVRTHVNEDFESIAEKNGGCIPAPLFQAMLLLIGTMYQNREVVGTRSVKLPYNYEYLIELYQNYNN